MSASGRRGVSRIDLVHGGFISRLAIVILRTAGIAALALAGTGAVTSIISAAVLRSGNAAGSAGLLTVSAAAAAEAAAPAAAGSFAAIPAVGRPASPWDPASQVLQDGPRRGREQAFAATGARDLRQWDARLVSLERDGRLRARRADTDTVLPGRRHERLDQYHGGVRVFGADARRETAAGLRPNYYLTDDGCNYDYFSGALDIVAHELAHGVTSHSSNLVYAYEPGALNEAFSDIIGTSAEFFFQPRGNGALRADYLIGEDVITPLKSWATPPLRSLADPRAYGDPDHYSRRYIGQSDHGGVHGNSTIASHTFYLAVEGGTNRTSGLSVQGVGAQNREQIEKAFYRAWVYMLPSYASFSLARAATIQSARELYGAGSPAERAVTQAWTAVGVY